jgi:hypothetical protein
MPQKRMKSFDIVEEFAKDQKVQVLFMLNDKNVFEMFDGKKFQSFLLSNIHQSIRHIVKHLYKIMCSLEQDFAYDNYTSNHDLFRSPKYNNVFMYVFQLNNSHDTPEFPEFPLHLEKKARLLRFSPLIGNEGFYKISRFI